MDKTPSSPSSAGGRELQCVGRLKIVRPKPVGFLCGSIPVSTDAAFHSFDSALVPSTQEVRAPRYQIIPPETDLNLPPLLHNIREKDLPIAAVRTGKDLPYTSGAMTSNLVTKGQALAVSGVAEYGDELDVIAPADILKQIFKIPYSKARLSVAVHRIGQTLVLNAGPDDEEGEKLVRRHKNHTQCPDKSLFLNFAMHSVRMEACDCPPGHNVQSEGRNSSVLPGKTSHVVGSSDNSQGEVTKDSLKGHNVKKDKFIFGGKKNRSKCHEAVKKVTKVEEKPRSLMQENDKYRRASNDGFLKVLFWQFHNFRMLLGSDLLIFSNEKYVAVSLHLWDVSRQVTPITWLEAWLDNVMASVPELAICYHQDGVVQGYELLKTDDIFLSKGISEDGSPAFHPHVVQQNGISVLRFLQENCKQDPGAYWLYKSAGEDAIQLFDLSIISQNGASDNSDDSLNSPPSLIHRGRSDSLLSLGTLLYRIAHRLSLSMAPADRARCASFFRKCLDFLDEPEHLVVRALAHEQFARLLLNCHEEPDVASEALIVESKATIVDAGDESFEFFSNRSESIVREIIYSPLPEDESTNIEAPEDANSEDFSKFSLDENMPSSQTIAPSETKNYKASETSDGQNSISADVSASSPIVQTVDPFSSKLAAIHHVSQAIKSLRWTWQMQNSTETGLGCNAKSQENPSSANISVCACGDTDCIEVCDIRQWLPTSKLDDKLWKLVLLLGESYLALGQAYKDDGQLQPALRVVKLACLVYGSMPQHLKDAKFISSMVCGSISDIKLNRHKAIGGAIEGKSRVDSDFFTSEQLSSTYLFWAKAWTLVGDVYVEFHMVKGKDVSPQVERNPFRRELKMSSEVLKEVKRLNKKLGPLENCSSCSLVNCSCKSDRASSGNSASSSRGDSRKQSKKATAKSISYRSEKAVADPDHSKESCGVNLDSGYSRQNKIDIPECASDILTGDSAESTPELHNSMPAISETSDRESKLKNGGIFKYLEAPLSAADEFNLSASLSCYEAASKVLGGDPAHLADLRSVVKKRGWVCNELGRRLLERKELGRAELAFIEAVKSFEEVSDHTNIILINCNLGHGRRTLAENMASKRDDFMHQASYKSAYNQVVETAKQEYAESLRYYEAAKVELNALDEEASSVPSSLKNEVHTQLANTYLRLGMLLATENTVAKVYGNGFSEDSIVPGVQRTKKDLRNREISASDAMREAIKLYESLGDLRKQEVAFAFFQLGFVQRDRCLRLLESDQKKTNISKGKSSGLQRVKQYASLAERNWLKALEFYEPRTHPMMYLTILTEMSDLSLSMSSTLNLNSMLDSAFTTLLEGRHVSKDEIPDSLQNESEFVYKHFWRQMQSVLKKLLSVSLSSNTNKSSVKSEQSNSNRPGEGKLRQLYKISLTPTDFSQLHEIYSVWIS
ncbi:Erythroid differentiation-related factor 1 [Heracleum sosnowskyi]|uniref:Erythroid differentiation-related factor 1 n=1 Tax=Heracleum sosnowskyi TaxID=360622 RepID=A0AAD8HS02_9APIA|nr:Erythroid differentiation-related factor 1 [Heracleum sosnowskyi]